MRRLHMDEADLLQAFVAGEAFGGAFWGERCQAEVGRKLGVQQGLPADGVAALWTRRRSSWLQNAAVVEGEYIRRA